MKTTSLLAGFLAGTAVLLVACSKQSSSLDQGWSARIKITESEDSLVGGVMLYKWHNTIFALQGQQDMSAKCFLMNSNDNSWSETPFTGVPQGYFWDWPAIDPDSDRVCFKQDYIQDDQLVMRVVVGRLTVNGGLSVREASENKWVTSKKSFFGETNPNIKFAEPGRRI